MKGGRVAYIEGNRGHPVNRGVLCAKGSAGIMQHNAPSRLRAPLRRVGPRGSGEFEEISWEEALQTAVSWLEPLRDSAPEKLVFFRGRDQSQSFTSFWAQNFGTPNYAAHGGFCSVNMASAGIYTMGRAFWEYGAPDWEHTKLFMLFGVAEDHDRNPIKIGLGKLKARGAKVIGVNPIRSGYNAVADEWVGITPGTDGLLILSLIHCLMKAGSIDLTYLAQYTNAPFLLDQDGLFLRDGDGTPLVIDSATGQPAPFDQKGLRPVSFHAMRGISAHANGFQTCRALHILQIILGAVETPGGMRFKPPYPKPVDAHPRPHAKPCPGSPLEGPHLGFPRGPEDLCLNEDGSPRRIDRAFTWDNPLSAHGLMHMVISNAHAGDPYKIDTLMLYMANMAWNSSMNTRAVMEMLTDTDDNGDYVIPRIIYSDAYSSEMVAYADLILPDTTYLERHDWISLLDRPISEPECAADAIRWPVVQPDREVRGFQSVLVDLANRMQLPGFTKDGAPLYQDYADYIVNHQRKPGLGPLAGWRDMAPGTKGARGAPNPDQLDHYIENGGFATFHIDDEASYFKPWNMAYQNGSVAQIPYGIHLVNQAW